MAKIHKTNAARILDSAKVEYELVPYTVDENNLAAGHIAEELGENFWRCHRSFLVNRSRIRAVHLKEQLVELDNGETCLLSRKAKSEYQKKN